MKIAIYGRCSKSIPFTALQSITQALLHQGAQVSVYAPFHCFFIQNIGDLSLPDCKLFASFAELDNDTDYMLSLGGDGTFLEAAKFVLNKQIPILGINLGRLGFLAQISVNEITNSLDDLFKGNFTIEKRSLLQVEGNFIKPDDFPHALNEISIQRNTPVMIKTTVRINNELLSSYWSDGLLVATPTGSTAYSLSVGGPVVLPNSHNFIITPIAPHNLSIRPIVIADDSLIDIQIITRKGEASVSIDNQMFTVDSGTSLRVKKSQYMLNFIKPHNKSFFKSLHDKLLWGVDPRN